MGNRGEPIGEAHHSSKLTEPQVREIKDRLDGDESLQAIADDYPVTKAAVGHISRGRVWTHV